MTETYDFVIIGGGSAGSAMANRLSADKANRVLVLEAGRSDYPWDVFIHMPAALAFPIGSRFYDWKYESEPEPHMNGRKVYHARGKVLGGSSSINGMIFQRGNPLDYERWGADPGMETWDYAHCLPYFKRMESCLAAERDDPFRGHSGPLVLERGPATNPLFGAFFEAVQQAGYPLTDDVNGYRQEGFAPFDRNVHDGKRLSAARAYLHPVMHRQNLEVHTRAFVSKILFEGTRAVGVEYTRGRSTHRVRAGRGRAVRRRDQLAADPDALGRRPRRASAGTRHRPGGRRARRRREPAGPPGGLHPVQVPAAGVGRALHEDVAPPVRRRRVALLQEGSGRHEPLRSRRVRAEQRGRRLPQPDVPLPADRDPLRRLGARGRPRLPGAHRPDVLRCARHDPAQERRPDACTRRCGSTTCRPNRTAANGSRRSTSRATSSARRRWIPFNGGEISPGPSVETDEQILDWVARDGETALHPSCTAKMGDATDPLSVIDPLTMKVHGTEGLRWSTRASSPTSRTATSTRR